MSEHENGHDVYHSEPIVGQEGTAYEGNDVKPGIVVWSLLIVATLTAMGFILMFLVQKYFEGAQPAAEFASPLAPARVVPPSPQVQVQPWEDLPEMRAAEEKQLHETGRDKAGRMHIPIENAMNDLLPRLKVDPNAPAGIRTPGGQGREYSHALSEIPGAASAQIQGEIRKNVQQ